VAEAGGSAGSEAAGCDTTGVTVATTMLNSAPLGTIEA
jgi:hypothetical protein